jgi:hypothetical protein
VYGLALSVLPHERARALVFLGIVVANVALIFVSRSSSETFAALFARQNAVFWWIGALACLAVAIVILVPGLATAFRFAPPPAALAATVAVAAISVVLLAGAWLRNQPARDRD